MKRSLPIARTHHGYKALPVAIALPCALALPAVAAQPAFAIDASEAPAVSQAASQGAEDDGGTSGSLDERGDSALTPGSGGEVSTGGGASGDAGGTGDTGATGEESDPDVAEQTWQQCGTCVWMVDAAGTLTIRPADGAETGALGTPTRGADGTVSWPWTASASTITAARIEGSVTPAEGTTSLEGLFAGLDKLASVSLAGLDTTQVTSLASMFRGCASLTSVDLTALDTSAADDLSSLFEGCAALTSVKLPASFGRAATDIHDLFSGCTMLSGLALPENFGAAARDMAGLFRGCQNLGALTLPTGFGLQVEDVSGMFEDCVLTGGLTLPQGFGGLVTNLSSFLAGAQVGAVTLPLGFGIQATDATSMFAGTTASSLSLPRAFGIALTTCDKMFEEAHITSVTIPEGFGDHLTSANEMFARSDVQTLDLTHLNTEHLAHARDLLAGCSKLTNVTLGREFSFSGSGTTELFLLPTDGFWQKVGADGSGLGDAVPADEFAAGYSAGRAGTYRKVAADAAEPTWESSTYPGENGSSTTVNRADDGTIALIDRNANLEVTSITVTVSASAAASGKATVPMRGVRAAATAAKAPTILVGVPGERTVTLTVPVALEGGIVSPGAVLVRLDANGAATVMPKTGRTEDGLCLAVSGRTSLKVVDEHETFRDIVGPEWYAPETAPFVNSRGILTGFVLPGGEVRFSGGSPTTRAMFVTMLNRLELAPKATEPGSFTDVPDSVWYAEPVAWGAENGIVSGFESGAFGGDLAVSREQICIFLMRYADYLGLDTSARGELEHRDADTVSPWAAEAVSWAVAEGYIMGDGSGALRPLDNASRAEAAAIVTRFVNGLYA